MPILGTYIDPEPLKQLLQDANEAGHTLEEHTTLIIMAHLERERVRHLLSPHTKWQMIPTLDPFGKARSLAAPPATTLQRDLEELHIIADSDYNEADDDHDPDLCPACAARQALNDLAELARSELKHIKERINP